MAQPSVVGRQPRDLRRVRKDVLLMLGIALARREFPDVMLVRLVNRESRRREDVDEEVHFMDHQRPRVLPVWYESQLRLLTWGRWCPLEEAAQW